MAGSAPDIFLSPRVIDRAAFEEFAGALRTLVERAEAATAILGSKAEAAEAAARAASEAQGVLQTKIEVAARLLVRLEDRAATVEAILGAFTDPDHALSRLDGTAATAAAAADRCEALVAQLNDRESAVTSALAAAADAVDMETRRAADIVERVLAARAAAEHVLAALTRPDAPRTMPPTAAPAHTEPGDRTAHRANAMIEPRPPSTRRPAKASTRRGAVLPAAE